MFNLQSNLIRRLLTRLIINISLSLPNRKLNKVSTILIKQSRRRRHQVPRTIRHILHRHLLLKHTQNRLRRSIMTLPLIRKFLLTSTSRHTTMKPRQNPLRQRLIRSHNTIRRPTRHTSINPIRHQVIRSQQVLRLTKVRRFRRLITQSTRHLNHKVRVRTVTHLILRLNRRSLLTLRHKNTNSPITLKGLTRSLTINILTRLTSRNLTVTIQRPLLKLSLLTTISTFLRHSLLEQRLLTKLHPLKLRGLDVRRTLLPRAHSVVVTVPYPAPVRVIRDT